MRVRTRKATYNVVVGTTPVEVLGPNPFRKAFMLAPVVASPVAAGYTTVAFAGGASQSFTVPAGITQLANVFVWGCGGAGGLPTVSDGGGGGGGGAFAALGPLAVVPAQVYTVNVDTPMTAIGHSNFVAPSTTVLVEAQSGSAAASDVGGVGGAAGTGPIVMPGGGGATATGLLGPGGGGGGSGGAYSPGGFGVGRIPGNPGGTTVVGAYGPGGAGGAGGPSGGDGVNGLIPGGGGGGQGLSGLNHGTGADGLAVVIYQAAATGGGVSLSPRDDVTVGAGTYNWAPGTSYPVCVCDAEIGDVIGEPWYLVSAVAGTLIQVTEFSYEPDAIEPAF